jgi:hypothetical protein
MSEHMKEWLVFAVIAAVMWLVISPKPEAPTSCAPSVQSPFC